jgi:hypothetical protein
MNSQGEVVANLGRSFGKTVIDAKNFNSSEVKNQQYALHAIRRNFIMRVWF